jgi:hypothetical protein
MHLIAIMCANEINDVSSVDNSIVSDDGMVGVSAKIGEQHFLFTSTKMDDANYFA